MVFTCREPKTRGAKTRRDTEDVRFEVCEHPQDISVSFAGGGMRTCAAPDSVRIEKFGVRTSEESRGVYMTLLRSHE